MDYKMWYVYGYRSISGVILGSFMKAFIKIRVGFQGEMGFNKRNNEWNWFAPTCMNVVSINLIFLIFNSLFIHTTLFIFIYLNLSYFHLGLV